MKLLNFKFMNCLENKNYLRNGNCLIRLEIVPNTFYGFNVLFANFLSQLSDMYVNGSVIVTKFSTPNFSVYFGTSKNFLGGAKN